MSQDADQSGMGALTLAGIDAYSDYLDKQPPPPGPQPSTFSRIVSDAGKSLKRGVEELPGMVTGLEDIPAAILTGRRPISQFFDYLGEKTGLQPGKWAAETQMSPQYQQSQQDVADAWKNGGPLDIAAAYAGNPLYTADQVIGSIPSLAMGGLVGKSVGAIGRIAAKAADATSPAIEAAPGVLERTLGPQGAASAQAAANIGSVTAGQQMENYTGPDQATNAALAVGSGTVAAILGAGIGQVAQKLGLETPQTAIAKIGEAPAPTPTPALLTSTPGRTAAGAVVGAAQGAAQGSTAQAAQNLANDQPITQGVGQQAVEGGLMGAVMGAGANLLGHANVPRETPPGAPEAIPATTPPVRPAAPDGGPVSEAVATLPAEVQRVPAPVEGAQPAEQPAAAPPAGPLEAAAAEMAPHAPDTVEQPGDIYTETGEPFASRVAARLAARAAGPQFEPVQIGEGQYVVRSTQTPANPVAPVAEPVQSAPAEQPPVEAQPAASTTPPAPENVPNLPQPEASPVQDATKIAAGNDVAAAPVDRKFLRKTLPAMTDNELALAQTLYPPDHPRQAKIAAQIADRAQTSTPGETSGLTSDQTVPPAAQPEAPGAAAAPVEAAAGAPAQADHQARWDAMGVDERENAITDAGYTTSRGTISMIGKRLTSRPWAQLPPTAANRIRAVWEAPPSEGLTSTPEEQRAAFQQEEAKRLAKVANLRAQAYQANPFKVFLAKHGVTLGLASEFAPDRQTRGQTLVRGYGPIFRRGGLNLDLLAQRAVEEGFLPTEDATRMHEMIARTIRGERIFPEYSGAEAEAEMKARLERARELEADAQESVPPAPEPAVRQAEEDAHEADTATIFNALEDGLDAKNNASLEDFLRAMGASEQEIKDEIANEAARAQARHPNGGQPDETAARAAPGGTGEGTANAGARDAGATEEGMIAPAPFEAKQQEFDNRGTRWRITVDRHWRVPVPESYEPDVLAWHAEKQVNGVWDRVSGDAVPQAVAKKASDFFDSVSKPPSDDLLTAPTADEIVTQQERAAQAERDKAKADAQAEKDAKAAADQKEIDARQRASAENFQLGQSAEDALSGQQDVFSATPEPAPPKTPAPQSNADRAVFTRRGDYWNYSGPHVEKIAKALDLVIQKSSEGSSVVSIPEHARTALSGELAKAGVIADFEGAPTEKPKRQNKAERERAEHLAKLADYFAPGNVVKGYGGFDEVVAYTPPSDGNNWSVKVHRVEKVDGQWVRVGGALNVRSHSTEPDARTLAAGPVERLAPADAATDVTTHIRGDLVEYTGKTEDIHGGKFYEFTYLEGDHKGETGVTQRAPDGTRPEGNESGRPAGIVTPQIVPSRAEGARSAREIAHAVAKASPDEDVAKVRAAARQAIIDELGTKGLQGMEDGTLMRGDALTQAVHDGHYEAIREFAARMPVPVHESDIPLEMATRAHQGTSYSPEERGASAQRQYVRAMADAWRQAERAANGDPAALERAKEAMEGLVKGYQQRYRAELASRSRVVSSGIVGPARFPLRANAKRMEIAERRAADTSEYLDKGIQRLIKATRAPIDNSPQGELERAKANLEAREQLQAHMKEANKALRRGDDEALRGMGMTDEQIAQFKKGDFAGRKGYPLYKITNNGAEIRRLRERLASAEKRAQSAEAGPAVSTRAGVRIEENAQDDRLRLHFDEKPGPEIRDDLKSHGFRWSPKASAWQRQLTPNARRAAEAVLDKHFPQSEPPVAKQARADYTGHYETDLFGEPLPAAQGKAGTTRPAKPEVPGDVQPAGALSDTPAPRGEYQTRTILSTKTERELGATRITTPAQAAQATKYLYRSAVERMDGIVTDADGKPLAVVGGFKGAITQTAAYPGTVIAEAIRIPGAKYIWLSHNHPSGSPQLSGADRNLNAVFANAFRGSGIEPKGLLAIGRGRFAYVHPNGAEIDNQPIPGALARVRVPVIERELGAGEPGRAVSSPQEARLIATKMYDKTKEPGLLLLNAQNEVMSWIPLDAGMAYDLRHTGRLNALYRAISESNASAAVIVHGGELERPVRADITAEHNIAAALKQAEVLPLDSINVRKAQSLSEIGLKIGHGPVYSLADEPVAPKNVAGFKDAAPEDQALADKMAALVKKGLPNSEGLLRAVQPDESAMTRAQLDKARAAEGVAREFGQKVVWVANDGRPPFNGAVSRHIPGVIFLRADSPRPYMAVLGHELLHQMRKTDPDIYDTLAARLGRLMTPTAQFDYFNKLDQRYGKSGLKTPRTWDEEQYADTVGDNFTDPEFWRRLAGSTPGLFKRVARAVTGFLDKVISAATGKRPFGSDEFFNDVRAARDAVVSAMGEYRNRVNADTDATTTPQFRSWFGESKVTDSDGSPLLVYHGSPEASDIGEFNIKPGAGVFFTNHPAVAGEYTSARGMWRGRPTGAVTGAYLSLKNPLEIDALGKRSDNLPVPWQEWRPKVFGNLPKDAINMQGALDYARSHGHDGLIVKNVVDTADTKGTQKSDVYVALRSNQIKSATGNSGAFDAHNPDIRYSATEPPTVKTMNAPAGELTPERARDQADVHFSLATSAGRALTDNKIVDNVHDYLDAPGRVSWWHKSIGTMYNLAQRDGDFKPVFETAQNFINDVSYYATEAANMAPRILPKLESWRDIGKRPIAPADNKAVQAPIFQGTLSYGRDEDGKLTRLDELAARYDKMPTQEKAQMLLKKRLVSEDQLKRWLASKIDVYDGAVNNRFKAAFLKAGVVFSDAELKSEFNLTPQQIGLYREFRGATDKSIDDAAKSDMVRFGGDDVAPIRDQIMATPKAKDAAQLAHDYLQSMAKEDAARAEELGDTAAGMLDRGDKAQQLQDDGYAPLSRFGKYTVDVMQDGKREYFGLFETAKAANDMARAMKAEYGEDAVTQGTLSQEEYRMLAGVTPETLELFGNALGLESAGASAADKVFQQYIKLTKTNRSAMRRLLHRQGIAGYSEDVGRVLANFVYSNSRAASAGLHIGDLGKAVTAIPKEKGQLKDIAVKLAEYVKNPQQEGQAARALLFSQYLGGSVASAMVNMTQPFATSFPYLSQFGGAMLSGREMLRAYKDVASRTTAYEPGLKAALAHAEETGVVSPQEVHQLMAQARGAGSLSIGDGTRAGDALAGAKNAMSRLSLAWGKVFGVAEQLNRRTTFIAAYRIAEAQGIKDPAAFAEKAVNETQFIYSKANKMQWGRGAIGGTLMTFKSYTISYLELLHRMYTEGGPEGKKAAALGVAVLFLMGGASGLPFEQNIEDLADGALERMGYNTSVAKWKEGLFTDLFGDAGGQFVNSGLSAIPGMPIDVSGRLGAGRIIPGTGLFKQREDHTSDVLDIVGPVGDLAKRFVQGGSQILSGDVLSGLNTMSPQAVRNATQAIDMARTGAYRDQNGYTVLQTTPLEAAMKGIGFQPASVAQVQQSNVINQTEKGFYSLQAQAIRAKWAQGIFTHDQEKVQEAKNDLADWNRKNPDQPMTANYPAIMRKVQQMGMSKDQRIAATGPLAMRRQLRADILARNAAQQ